MGEQGAKTGTSRFQKVSKTKARVEKHCFGKGEVESSIPSSSTSGVIGLFPKVAFSFYGEGGQRHPVEWPDKTRHSGRRRINRRLVG